MPSFNNTLVTITDTQGNTLSWASAGAVNFKGSRKGTPFAAQMAAENASRKAQEHGLKRVDVQVAAQGRAAKRQSAPCKHPGSKSCPFPIALRCRTTAAALLNDVEFNETA